MTRLLLQEQPSQASSVNTPDFAKAPAMERRPSATIREKALRFLHSPWSAKFRAIRGKLSSPWKTCKCQMRRRLMVRQEASYQRFQTKFAPDLSFSEMAESFPERNAMHAYAVHYYAHHLPARLCDHRTYFKQNQRGFGEDAFHAMWWLLLREFRCRRCLEIGVYRGQVISLWALISQMLDSPCDIHCISPFLPLGDAVSVYREDVDYLTDTLDSFKHFDLPAPTWVRALSTDSAAVEHISRHRWDLIYIDGSHEYEIALADYRLCSEYLAPGGFLVMDDASLGTSFHPPRFSFAGHPGPSRVAAEYAMRELQFVGAVGHNNVFRKAA